MSIDFWWRWCTKYSTGISCVVNNSLSPVGLHLCLLLIIVIAWSPVDFTLRKSLLYCVYDNACMHMHILVYVWPG
jgi:hypothetical protein